MPPVRDTSDSKRAGHYPVRVLFFRTAALFRPWLTALPGLLLVLAVTTALTIAGPYLIKQAIDEDIAHADYAALRVTVLLFFLVQVGVMLTTWLLRNWVETIGQRMMASLRNRLVAHLIDLPVAFHDKTSPGELLSRVESDTQALRMLFTTTAVTLIGDACLFAGMFAVMIVVSPRLALVTGCAVPLLVLVSVYFQKKIQPIFLATRRQNAALTAKATEYLSLLPVIQAFDRQRYIAREFYRENLAKYTTQLPGERAVIIWFNLLFFLQTLTFIAILGLGGYWAMAGLVTIGTLVMFIGYVRRFTQPLVRLSEQLAVIQRALASAERIYLLLDQSDPVTDPEHPADFAGTEIRFENVFFRYAEEGDWILDDVSFTLDEGSSLAIVGPTGSGKSTLISLLLRFREPQAGTITIGGVDIREFNRAELRKRIGLVQQEIHLFPGSLIENLTLGDPEAEAQLEQTLLRTGTKAIVDRLPDGDATTLAERGANLSLGERQLLSMTRALVRDPEIVILDEATSAIDPATEAELVEMTHRLIAGRTSVLIAHRLSTIRDCDRVLVLRAGRIEQFGTYDGLVAEEGLFRNLHELQFGTADA